MQYFIRKEGMPMLSIGIDVSKGKSTVCGMKPGGEIVYTPFEVQHTREGISDYFLKGDIKSTLVK